MTFTFSSVITVAKTMLAPIAKTHFNLVGDRVYLYEKRVDIKLITAIHMNTFMCLCYAFGTQTRPQTKARCGPINIMDSIRLDNESKR